MQILIKFYGREISALNTSFNTLKWLFVYVVFQDGRWLFAKRREPVHSPWFEFAKTSAISSNTCAGSLLVWKVYEVGQAAAF